MIIVSHHECEGMRMLDLTLFHKTAVVDTVCIECV
jgi:hypothetical protein